jgi:hypothetical protein
MVPSSITGAMAVPAAVIRLVCRLRAGVFCRAVKYPEKSFPDNVADLGKVWRTVLCRAIKSSV